MRVAAEDSIHETVFDGSMAKCVAFVAMGSIKYGQDTGNNASNHCEGLEWNETYAPVWGPIMPVRLIETTRSCSTRASRCLAATPSSCGGTRWGDKVAEEIAHSVSKQVVMGVLIFLLMCCEIDCPGPCPPSVATGCHCAVSIFDLEARRLLILARVLLCLGAQIKRHPSVEGQKVGDIDVQDMAERAGRFRGKWTTSLCEGCPCNRFLFCCRPARRFGTRGGTAHDEM